MLQNLLSERFQLRLHRETRSFRVYHLVVAKNGPKFAQPETIPIKDKDEQMKLAQEGLAMARARLANEGVTNHFGLNSASVADFIDRLSLYVDRPIIDSTQISGRYKFQLGWAAGMAQKEGAPQGPFIFGALRVQLGLELKPASAEIEVLAN